MPALHPGGAQVPLLHVRLPVLLCAACCLAQATSNSGQAHHFGRQQWPCLSHPCCKGGRKILCMLHVASLRSVPQCTATANASSLTMPAQRLSAALPRWPRPAALPVACRLPCGSQGGVGCLWHPTRLGVPGHHHARQQAGDGNSRRPRSQAHRGSTSAGARPVLTDSRCILP